MNRTEDGLAAFQEAALRLYGNVESPLSLPGSRPPYRLLHDQEQHAYLEEHKGMPAEKPGSRLAGPAVRPRSPGKHRRDRGAMAHQPSRRSW